MIRAARGAAALVALALVGTVPLSGQGPRLGWTPSYSAVNFERGIAGDCAPAAAACAVMQRSSTGRAVGRGALIGLGFGVVTGILLHSLCSEDDSADRGSCLGKSALYVGLTTATGALIGFILGQPQAEPRAAPAAAATPT